VTGSVINLNKMRKAKAQRDKAQAAKTQRALFGRTKGQKAIAQADAERSARTLDGARREPDPV